MGNCYGVPVEDLSTIPSKNTTPETSRQKRNNYGDTDDEIQVKQRRESSSSSSTGSKVALSPNLKVFTAAELRSATRNFKPDTMLGEGGFGRVYKGWIDHKTYAPSKVGVGMAVAVKKSNPDADQGLQEWQSEVKFLSKFSHPNLVRLIGYCCDERDFYLVYEYMQKGSLENHLFRKGAEPIPWDIRLKIAIGAARGLAFLHSSEKSVIYRDFKASNILLDGEFNAKLSDFGLAKFGPNSENSHITTRVMGTYGYAAPEYVATGHLYVRSDVYGFGVVLLEILTGMRAHDPNRPSNSINLVDWAKPSLSSKKKLKKLMDPRLEAQYSLKAASQAAELILKCLESDPYKRPCMDQVLDALEKANAVSVVEMQADRNAVAGRGRDRDQEGRVGTRTRTRPHQLSRQR